MQEIIKTRYFNDPLPQSIVKNTSMQSLMKELEGCEKSNKNLASMIAEYSSADGKAKLQDTQVYFELRRLQVKKRMANLLQKDLPVANPEPVKKELVKKVEVIKKSSKVKEWVCGACGQKGHTLRSPLCPKKEVPKPKKIDKKEVPKRVKRKADQLMMQDSVRLQDGKAFKKVEADDDLYRKKRVDYRKIGTEQKKTDAAQALMQLWK